MSIPTEINLPDYTYKAKLVKVVDGDTIDVSLDLGCFTYTQKRLRFLGINAYELYRGTEEEKVLGKKAKQFVIDVLNLSENIYIQTKMDAEGKYGRLLAWVWYTVPDGGMVNLNKLLLDEGLAVIYT